MDEQEQLGARIASMRALRKLRQSDLALKIGTSTQTVSNWETGSCVPRADSLRDLCLALGCSSDYLLGLSGTPSPSIAIDYLPRPQDDR